MAEEAQVRGNPESRCVSFEFFAEASLPDRGASGRGGNSLSFNDPSV